MSGIERCKLAREFYQQPILILTACDDDISEVNLLKMGADDYLVIPLRPHVLVVRTEALLRRSQVNLDNQSTPSTTEAYLTIYNESSSDKNGR